VPEDLIAQDQAFCVYPRRGSPPAESNAATGWPQIPLQSIMPQGMMARWPAGLLGPPIDAGTRTVGLVMAPEEPLPRKSNVVLANRELNSGARDACKTMAATPRTAMVGTVAKSMDQRKACQHFSI
jgi:hypothetical protein